MKKNIFVSFPLDRRIDDSRNELLDGTNHEIEINQVSAFEVNNQIFYLVDGYDVTRGCEVSIVLTVVENVLRKVPLMNYDELTHYTSNLRGLSEEETQSLFNSNGNYVPTMPITTISTVVSQIKKSQKDNYMIDKYKQRIMVFNDLDGRKFILSSAAEYLGLPAPRSINYLPLKNQFYLARFHNIYGPDGYRLLSDIEYNWIQNEFDVTREEVNNVDVIEYQGNYYVQRIIFEGNYFGLAHAFYNFGDDFFDCVPLNAYQREIVDSYYRTNYHVRDNLISIDGDPSRLTPEPWYEDSYNSRSVR